MSYGGKKKTNYPYQKQLGVTNIRIHTMYIMYITKENPQMKDDN